VRWYLALSEFQFTIMHVPGVDNVVADVLSRFFRMVAVENQEVDVQDLLKSLHNSDVGHIGGTRLLKTLEGHGIKWDSMSRDVRAFIKQCPICQKLKRQSDPIVLSQGYTLTSSAPFECISVDTIGPLSEDQDGNKYILHIMDAFSKFNMVIATKNVDAMSYVHGLLLWIGMFGVPLKLRTDGGSQFTAKVSQELAKFLGTSHRVVVPYHPQANGDNERWNAEVTQVLRAIVLDRRVSDRWSQFLPMVQRILNSTYTSSIDTFPARVIFGDHVPASQPFLLRKDTAVPFQPIHQYIRELNEDLTTVVDIIQQKFQSNLQLRQQASSDVDTNKVVSFEIGDFVLLTYPSQRPTKLASLYRGPMRIVNKIRDDIFEVMDLMSHKVLTVHVDRLRVFTPGNLSEQDILNLAAADVEEFIVKEILDHRYTGSRKTKKNLEFLVSWEGYEPEYDSWEPYSSVKDVQALDTYSAMHPELQLG
jgi:hypothetical protein